MLQTAGESDRKKSVQMNQKRTRSVKQRSIMAQIYCFTCT